MRDSKKPGEHGSNTKFFILLLIVLGINSLRYGNYLLEDSTNIYNWVFLILNLVSLLLVLLMNTKRKNNS
ncbi:hypothetical protein Pryu01_02782 [Paraliobacillus ryukyuensis]|uniref:Uncharacterized protein n=1 Tax=Paraliobacillus ryukyuensis TaxID=200904 RepID=A0A366DVJ1_9BACI|nr:hypothetical protein [Paraliobacillus ryukyuensis]RBO93208.1 hypothetical protein DES48_1129 [Paraliobacillus ryukyuensis]